MERFDCESCKAKNSTNPHESLKFLREYSVDMEKLVCEKKFSDCKLIIDQKEVPVHKAILSSRSPIFAEILNEQTTSIVINDVDYDGLLVMLHFLYTGSIDNLNFERAKKVIPVLNKYEVNSLKKKCENLLSQELDTENAIELLVFAEKNNAHDLKDVVIKFVVENLNEYKAPQFRQLLAANPEILVEILEAKAFVTNKQYSFQPSLSLDSCGFKSQIDELELPFTNLNLKKDQKIKSKKWNGMVNNV